MTKTILLIGGDMYLGRLLSRQLQKWDYDVRTVDSRAAVGGGADVEQLVGDLADPALLDVACRGVFAVVDLSKLDGSRWDDDIAQGTAGTVALWEAARRAGVRRMVTLTSDSTVGFYRRSAVLDHLSLPRPDSTVGVLGALIESMATLYAYKYGMSTLSVRMGSCKAEPTDERMLSTWLSPADFLRLIKVALTADYCSEIIYGVSANARGWWDNANAVRLGYRPADKAETYAEGLRGRRSANIVENVFQGGPSVAQDFAGDIRRIP